MRQSLLAQWTTMSESDILLHGQESDPERATAEASPLADVWLSRSYSGADATDEWVPTPGWVHALSLGAIAALALIVILAV